MSLQIKDPDRGTGRTTRRALAYVHLLINRPGEKVFIRDHAEAAGGNNHIFKLVATLLDSLRIDHKIDNSDYSITVRPLLRKLDEPEIEE